MSTTRIIQAHAQTISGMDSTKPPHLVPGTQWTNSSGFRSYYSKVQQFGLFTQGLGFNPFPNIQRIIPIPTGFRTEVHPVMLTSAAIYRLDYTLINGGGTPTVIGSPGCICNATDRIAATLYNNNIWFCSPDTKLRWCDGTQVGTYETEVPSARYIDNFFDHIVVANCTLSGIRQPWTFRFSDLYNPGVWTPTDTNEADFYDVVSWQRDYSIIAGITGAGKINDRYFVYTDSCIVGVNYVGLPKVFQVAPAWLDYGNAFINGLVVSKDAHFFFDGYHQNFFIFDGANRPTPIGDPILGFFLNNITLNFTSTDTTQELLGFTMPERSEAWWVFKSNDGVSFWAIVYNWKSNEWTKLRLPSMFQGVGGGGTVAKTVSELGATAVNALTGEVGSLSATDVKFFRHFTSAGFRFREEQSSDAIATLQSTSESPTLETKDFYDDLQREIEIDRFCIHADYVASAGIAVYVSARQSLQDPVVYKKVGTWTKETRQGIITFASIRARVLRYKFEFLKPTGITVPARGCVFYNYTDNLFDIKAEQ